ncbi:MAG: 5-oxoprolinase (ATP-hydrolyzing) subunit [Mycobacteriales bacterium]
MRAAHAHGSRVRLEIAPYGDSAVLATAVGGDDEQRWRAVHRLADLLPAAAGLGVVATYDSLLVEFDCELTSHREVTAELRGAAARLGERADGWAGGGAGGPTDGRVGGGPAGAVAAPAPRTFHVPVAYGGEHGPDLPAVAAELGLPVDEVVRLHSATPWTVRFLGAPAGAPMLDGSPFPAPVPRRRRPRTRVPAGSVAVAGLQAVVYPVPSPGGWQLIGRTPLRLIDIDRVPHVAYRPGDVMRFVPVDGLAGRPDTLLEPDG